MAATAPARRKRERMGSRTTRRRPQILLLERCPLPTDEAGSALLGERGEPLLRVLAGEQAGELLRLLLERARREVDETLRDRERAGALRGELLSDLERMVEHRIGDPVHEPDAQRLLRVDLAPGEDELLRDTESADAR